VCYASNTELKDLVDMSKNINRRVIINRLRKEKPELERTYGVKKLAIFGSFARDQATDSSDVDILVELGRPLGLEFVRLANHLEEKLGREVDLATFQSMQRTKRSQFKRQMVENIEKDLVYV
jgi:predicted nucleotidyltransferase